MTTGGGPGALLRRFRKLFRAGAGAGAAGVGAGPCTADAAVMLAARKSASAASFAAQSIPAASNGDDFVLAMLLAPSAVVEALSAWGVAAAGDDCAKTIAASGSCSAVVAMAGDDPALVAEETAPETASAPEAMALRAEATEASETEEQPEALRSVESLVRMLRVK